MVCGTNTSDAGAIWFYNYLSSSPPKFAVCACFSSGWKYNKPVYTPLDTDIHILRYVGNADGCYQISDGVQSDNTNISQWANGESTNNFFIFGRSSTGNPYKGRIYYLWVKDTDTNEYICDLVPCKRKSDDAAGFWDRKRLQFFTSSYWTAHNETT